MTDSDFLQRLGPKTRERLLSANSLTSERLATPSIGLNMSLRGGLGRGRTCMVWGNKSAGKSSFLQQMIAIHQAMGEFNVGWVDGESSFDPEWAERLGVDTNRVIVSRSKTISRATRDVVDFCNAGADMVVVDSISVLLPSMYFNDKEELKDVADVKQMGQESREMKGMVNEINYANDRTLVVLVSQARNNLGAMYVSKVPTGGEATKFNCSTVVKLWSSESEANAIKGKIQVGDRIYEEKVGRPVNWVVDYNKLGPMNQTGTYDFYYQGDNVGLDNVGETLDYAEKYGVVEKGGAWYKVQGERLQGRANAVKWLRENPEQFEIVQKELYGRI